MENPTISVSLSRKVNLGGYESADVFVCVSGLPQGTTEADVDALLETGALAYGRLRVALAREVDLARQK